MAPLTSIGQQERAEMMLELHGNMHVRAATSDWLATTASHLIKVVWGLFLLLLFGLSPSRLPLFSLTSTR
jgi:hypothetical protein